MQIPNASAVDHTVGNLDINALTDWGRILMPIQWNGIRQTVEDQSTPIGFIGLVIDHDNYDHTPGSEDIADSFASYPYTSEDDFKPDNPITMIFDDGITQKSYGSFKNKGLGTGFPDDILINQTTWTVKDKDWAIIQWSLSNIKSPASTLTNVRIGLEVPISKEGGKYGLGGSFDDSGDDVDGYDAVEDIYWAQDTGDSTTMGFGSAIASDPITHYYAKDYYADYSSEYKNFFGDDTWLYQRLGAPSATATDGVTPKNITATVGWDGFDILAGESRNFTLVVAMDVSLNDMTDTFKEAQDYYNYILDGFRITEFSDADSGTQQVEVYNDGYKTTDLSAEGFFLSVDNGASPLSGTWDKVPLPTYEYGIYTLDPGENIGPEGATLGLYKAVGGNTILISEVAFGQEGTAPDPLNGESVARHYDLNIGKYTNDWVRNSSTGPTWGAQNDVDQIVLSPPVVLNRVMFDPLDPFEAYIEVYYRGIPRDISGYKIICDDEFVVPAGTNLDSSNPFFILNYSSQPTLFDNMNPAGDNVYLYFSAGRLLDMVGWNTIHIQGRFIGRSTDAIGTYRGYDDTTSSNAGWVFDQLPELLITEFYMDTTTAQIEIYNDRGGDKVLGSNWELRIGSGPITGAWTNDPLLHRHKYACFLMTAGSPSGEGDTISLFYDTLNLVDEVSFGINGVAPDPLIGESSARYWNGTLYTDVWGRNESSGPSFGSLNAVPSPDFDSQAVLNEILFYPAIQSDAFIEIYIKWGLVIDISGYRIVGDAEYIIPGGTYLTDEDPFFYLTQYMAPMFFAAMNSNGDNIYLYDDNGGLLDMAGWSSPHFQGTSMCRVPLGNGTRDGYDDTSSDAAGWVYGFNPTIPLVKMTAEDRIIYGNLSEVVSYTLTITNLNSIDDTYLISNTTLNGYNVTIYDETGTYIITKVTVPGNSSMNITVMVTIPSDIMLCNSGNVTIAVLSENSSLIGNSTVLQTRLLPFIQPKKFAFPQEIYVNGAGHDETSVITLNLSGMGYLLELYEAQDVIFCVDTSSSMSPDSVQKIKEGLNDYVDEMSEPDMGAVVIFGGVAWLMNPLTDNYTQLRMDIDNIPDPSGGTPMTWALQVAIEELLANGISTHIPVIILLTDGKPSGGPSVVLAQADIAAANDIVIYTIGLGNADEALLQEVANRTGGKYFYADESSEIPEIYLIIASYIFQDTAGRDTDITDAIPMVRDVLPSWIELINGSFSIEPDVNYVNETGYRILEWNISQILINQTWGVTFEVKSNRIGWVYANDVDNSRICYIDFLDSNVTKLFPECLLHVLGPVQPPALFINVSSDGNDAVLYWDPPPTPGIDHYLLYRSTSQTDFDFKTVWVNTSRDNESSEPSPIPLRTMWNDTNAALPGDPSYEQQYYYIIRTVNDLGEVSSTSRTVGKWTRTFPQGISTFSLPLEPLGNFDTEWYTSDMNAEYIKYMNTSTHFWMQHNFGDGNTNNTQMKLGEGYVVKFGSQTNYTFTGMPGAMIKHRTGGFIGFDYNTDAKNLSVSVDPLTGNVNLTWDQPSSMNSDDSYDVYRSTTRDGFDTKTAVLLDTLPYGNETYLDPKAASSPGQYYYMIVPVNETGFRGSSTYSIGIWTEEYLPGYDTFGIPLKLSNNQTSDWYCDNIPDTVGINYFIYSQERWSWHSTRMSAGAFDPVLEMAEGYQISTSSATKFTFVGV
jgi:uncharacterized protein YegL